MIYLSFTSMIVILLWEGYAKEGTKTKFRINFSLKSKCYNSKDIRKIAPTTVLQGNV